MPGGVGAGGEKPPATRLAFLLTIMECCMSIEPYIPDERTKKHCEFILSCLDEDIAHAFREYGYGTYKPDSPLLLQLLRNLRAVADALRSNRVIKADTSNDSQNNSGDGQYTGEPISGS